VRRAQRERLLRAVIAAVGQAGFGSVTVADIVRGARVSRAAFYAHFSDKEDCFLAATRQGGLLMAERVVAASRRQPADASAEATTFARAFYIEMPAAGPRAVRQVEAGLHGFARMNRAWHERARRDHPDWPAVPYQAYYALAGATTELVRAEVRTGTARAITSLEDTLVALHLSVLAARPWLLAGTP
jgi:AcrR family transcriptional regulator